MTNQKKYIINIIIWIVTATFLLGLSLGVFRVLSNIYEYTVKWIYEAGINAEVVSVEKISVIEQDCVMIDNSGDSIGLPVAYEV